MKKLILSAVALIALVVPASSLAAGDGSNAAIGDCISDGFYGNEPNIVDPFEPGGPAEQEPGSKAGRVVPSQSPGPFVTLPDGSVVKGNSLGYYHDLFKGAGVAAGCVS
jgi:hypothetical protein